MRLLLYKDLDLRRVKPTFEKVRAAIEADDFRSADVKKLNAGPYYRAKLDYANRLLLQFARVSHGEGTATVCLALEVIENHAYDKSRFLRGAVVDEAKIEREPATEATAPPSFSSLTSSSEYPMEFLVNDLKIRGWKRGDPIVLNSCNTGSFAAGPAQKLADITGSVVYASRGYFFGTDKHLAPAFAAGGYKAYYPTGSN